MFKNDSSIVDGIIRWHASMIMQADAQQGTLLSNIVGIVGAFLASLMLSPLLGMGAFHLSGFGQLVWVMSLLGAVVFMAGEIFFRGETAR